MDKIYLVEKVLKAGDPGQNNFKFYLINGNIKWKGQKVFNSPDR